jgi:hypothetical protein
MNRDMVQFGGQQRLQTNDSKITNSRVKELVRMWKLLVQGDQKVCMHLIFTIQKVTSNVLTAWQPTTRVRGTLDSH